MKVRISHFTTKNIEVNEITKSRPKSPKIVQRERQAKPNTVKTIQTKTTKKPPTGIKLERISLKEEANYAGIPRRQESEVIKKLVDKEAAKFRKIK